jgi:hypothetical protein
MRGRSCRAEQGLQMGRERRGAKGSHVSGWQGTTTRTSPDRDTRPGDVESRCRMLLGQSRISALGRACGRAGVGVATGMGDLKATVPGLSMGTNIDAPRALGPNPKQVAPAWSKNPDGPTGLQ